MRLASEPQHPPNLDNLTEPQHELLSIYICDNALDFVYTSYKSSSHRASARRRAAAVSRAVGRLQHPPRHARSGVRGGCGLAGGTPAASAARAGERCCAYASLGRTHARSHAQQATAKKHGAVRVTRHLLEQPTCVRPSRGFVCMHLCAAILHPSPAAKSRPEDAEAADGRMMRYEGRQSGGAVTLLLALRRARSPCGVSLKRKGATSQPSSSHDEHAPGTRRWP